MSSISAQQTEFVWSPRRQVTLAQTQRRSNIVRFLRLAFTAGAAISIGVLAGPVIANALSGLDAERRTFGSDEIVTMINPRFTGRDQGGDSYIITADTAQRRRADDNLIDLTSPMLVDQSGSRITAPEGTYDQDAQTLDLYRDVQVADQGGYRFRTTSARFYILEGRIEGLDPLYGSGPLGDIRSDAYEITEDGSVITFLGNVEMVFEPAPPREAPPGENEETDSQSEQTAESDGEQD
ncbi:MAG: LPS export ABC transporter periplasmic protein LptC [Hyphomonadaceae bacterium]|nr:LPS export ABC transporter periplasmic protein LptC [Hyphomonadaceae bacterium]